jgi:hypothetical protein
MESLKKFEEICQKDSRQDSFSVLDPNHRGIFRKRTLEDFHRMAASISLHDGVPEEIRSHFATARNLVVYSWFYYPFNVSAQLSAYISVEFALKHRSGKLGSTTSFSRLLKHAVKEGWISDKGFSHPKLRSERIRSMNEAYPPEFRTPEPALIREYCDALVKTMPFLRNDLAHGSSFLWEAGASHVRVCAELVNQLFPDQASTLPGHADAAE